MSARLAGPGVALLHDTPVGAEAEERRPGNRLDRAIRRCDHAPPVDRGAIARDERLAETAVRLGLVRECPADVLA